MRSIRHDKNQWIESTHVGQHVALEYLILIRKGGEVDMSFSIDIDTIFSYASQIVSSMMPLIGLIAGLSFGFALVAWIIRIFRTRLTGG